MPVLTNVEVTYMLLFVCLLVTLITMSIFLKKKCALLTACEHINVSHLKEPTTAFLINELPLFLRAKKAADASKQFFFQLERVFFQFDREPYDVSHYAYECVSKSIDIHHLTELVLALDKSAQEKPEVANYNEHSKEILKLSKLLVDVSDNEIEDAEMLYKVICEGITQSEKVSRLLAKIILSANKPIYRNEKQQLQEVRTAK